MLCHAPPPSKILFNENRNMHLMYNKTKEATDKYLYIEMYKADQPTVSRHKQKIYWN